jgi:hypothetical protein
VTFHEPFSLTDLNLMSLDIRANNIKLGWHPHDLELGEVFALLHTEVAEMTDAYRVGGFEDKTQYFVMGDGGSAILAVNPKPEGVGSEMADVLIRLLDNHDMLPVGFEYLTSGHGRFGFSDRFGTVCNTLHTLIAKLSMFMDSYESCPLPDELPMIGRAYRDVYQYLIQAAEHFGVDLAFEYHRKMDYNKTRAYRHGGKKI